ncbi:hypothetical protein E2320_020615, partial [Naja naja]
MRRIRDGCGQQTAWNGRIMCKSKNMALFQRYRRLKTALSSSSPPLSYPARCLVPCCHVPAAFVSGAP